MMKPTPNQHLNALLFPFIHYSRSDLSGITSWIYISGNSVLRMMIYPDVTPESEEMVGPDMQAHLFHVLFDCWISWRSDDGVMMTNLLMPSYRHAYTKRSKEKRCLTLFYFLEEDTEGALGFGLTSSSLTACSKIAFFITWGLYLDNMWEIDCISDSTTVEAKF